jgi:hypothetical protein
MALVAVVAILIVIDLEVSRDLESVPTAAARIGVFGALPMAHVLAVYLVIVVSSLKRQGEVALSRFVFVLTGGTAILSFIAVVDLAPQVFTNYVSATALLWERSGRSFNSVMRFGIGGIGLTEAVIVCGIVTPLLLLPSLLGGWMTRGYRLKLLKGSEEESESGRAITREQPSA